MTSHLRMGIILLAAVTCGCAKQSQPDQQTSAARVNGTVISRAEVERYFGFRAKESGQTPTGEAEKLAKMEILHDLIEREIMSQKAGELKLLPNDADVEKKIQELRGAVTPEQFKKDLEQRGITDQDMRTEVRRTLTVEKLVQDQINSKVQVAEAEINSFYEQNRESFNIKEPQLRIAQIVVTSNASGQIANTRNDKALNDNQAVAKIQSLYTRIQAGEDFQQLAREYSEDPQSAPTGGDLGYRPVSSLEGLGAPLVQTLTKMKPGDVTPVIRTPDGYWVLKLIGTRDPGLRTLRDQDVQESIREELRSRKQRLLTAAFSEQLRNQSRVENYLAEEVIAGFQKSK